MHRKIRTYQNYKICLFILDTLLIFSSFYISLILNKYKYTLSNNYGYIIAIYLLTMIFYIYFDFYRYKSFILIKRYLLTIILINIIIFGIITLFIFVTPFGDKIVFIDIFKFYIIILLLSFIIIRILIIDLIFKGLNRIKKTNQNAIVLGVNKESKLFYNIRDATRENNGLNIIGFIDLDDSLKNKKNDFKFLGDINNILDLSAKYKFRDIFLIKNKLSISRLINIIEYLRINNFTIHVDTGKLKILSDLNLYDIYGTDKKFIDFNINRKFYRRYLKIILDYIFSIFFLIIILPVFFLILILIKITSKGPALFISQRTGLNGKNFNFIKFRTMKHDVGENIKNHKESMKPFFSGKENGKIKMYGTSTRVTRIGKFLRKFSLDELPQFINVLKNDISVIGPRPFPVYEAVYFKGWRKYKFYIKQGITGMWQAYGRSKVNFEKMSILDYYYYSNCSFSLDLKIFFDTVKVSILGIGGY